MTINDIKQGTIKIQQEDINNFINLCSGKVKAAINEVLIENPKSNMQTMIFSFMESITLKWEDWEINRIPKTELKAITYLENKKIESAKKHIELYGENLVNFIKDLEKEYNVVYVPRQLYKPVKSLN
jgi:hypothetical protein